MNVLVVIPARGGSKGIPHKNIYPLCGKTLLEWTIECILNVTFNGDVVVSTDDDMIADVARKYKKVMIIKRPDEISGDTASTESALIHAVTYMKKEYGKEYDVVVTLQATSPLRTSEMVSDAFKLFEEKCDKYDSLLTLTEDRTDFWSCDENGRYGRLFPDAPRRRQERKPLFAENSALYITRTDTLIRKNSVLGDTPLGYPINAIEAIDINEMVDIYFAESILKARE